MSKPTPFITAMLVPTGVGASIGGFGGDASPQMNAIAEVSDVLITHPNVANAAVFQNLPPNGLYVEGYALDHFLSGQWSLSAKPPKNKPNRIGVVMDSGMEAPMKTLHLNVLNAVRTVYGLPIQEPLWTENAIEIDLVTSDNGASSGEIRNPQCLIDACQKSIDAGADVIALGMTIPEADEASELAYQQHGGVDPIGGVEALLSHLIVSTFKIPCANAPVFSKEGAEPAFDRLVDPRTAAEFIAPTFMPCVLQGLAHAPAYSSTTPTNDFISVGDLNAVVMPQGCFGGSGVLGLLDQIVSQSLKTNVIVVAENTTVLNQHNPPEHLQIQLQNQGIKPIIRVQTYQEAVRTLQSLRSVI